MFANTIELRRSLMQDLTDLREGRITVPVANARARLAKTIVATVSIEIAAATLGKPFDAVQLLTTQGT